jgi:hypothetical protein
VENGVFACVYQGPGLRTLRLLKIDGSVVDPELAGYEMRNHTWNRVNKPGGAGDEVYFVVLMTDHYSLLLRGKEVWTFGQPLDMGEGLSVVSKFCLLARARVLKKAVPIL